VLLFQSSEPLSGTPEDIHLVLLPMPKRFQSPIRLKKNDIKTIKRTENFQFGFLAFQLAHRRSSVHAHDRETEKVPCFKEEQRTNSVPFGSDSLCSATKKRLLSG